VIEPITRRAFLRQFGPGRPRADRRRWFNPTTPQALTMLNGRLFDRIASDGSPLAEHAARPVGRDRCGPSTSRCWPASRRRRSGTVLAKLGGDGATSLEVARLVDPETRQFLFVN
jgi:hypothetical protein